MSTTTTPDGAPAPPSTEGSAGASASVAATVSVSASVPETRFSWLKLLWISSPLGLLGILIYFEVPLCPTRNLIGVPCPGCGLTRATESMLVGDFAAMLQYHPLAPIVTPFVVFSVLRAVLVSAGAIPVHKTDPLSKLPDWLWPAVGISLVVLWGVRLFGGLGGLPDEVNLSAGWLYMAGHFLFHDLWVALGVLG